MIKRLRKLSLQRIKKIIWIRKVRREREMISKIIARNNDHGLVLKEIQGSKMWLDTTDKGISLDLILDGIREKIATREFKKKLKPGMFIADIGANIGYYALMEAKAIGNKGKVYAIEPSPDNVELLKKNIKENGYRNIEVIQSAIGSENKPGKLFLSSARNVCSIHNPTKRSVDVKIRTLDSILNNKRVDFVRMDVEGYEYEIIKGMEKILSRKNKPGLFIEVHEEGMGERKTKEFFEMLKSYGYSFKIYREFLTELKEVSKHVSEDVFSIKQNRHYWIFTD